MTLQNDKKPGPLEDIIPVSRQAACEGIVLLKNDDEALPLKKEETISLFGRCQINTYRSGTGSGGAVNVPYAVNALEGLRANTKIRLNEDLVSIYEDWIKKNPFDDGNGGWAAEPWYQHEMLLADELVSKAATSSEKALVFIGRTAGEAMDNADERGSYRLTELEETMITTVTKHFKQVIIILNCSNVIDMSWLEKIDGKESIKAVLYNWAAGMEGGHALADVLSGDVCPSGRLTDTIAYRLEDHPSSANFGNKKINLYSEDIYVGYQYFETFKPSAVQYPFGTGLSYTEFSFESISLVSKGSGAEQEVIIEVDVLNTGTTHSGKEVVQVYCEAPQGALGKPARVLAGFSKTGVLKPGEREKLTIAISMKTLASYDDGGATGNKSCYVLEAGEYHFYLGKNVRKAKLIETPITYDKLIVTQILAEALAPVQKFDRLKPGHRKEDGCYEETKEPVPQRSIDIAKRIESNLPPSYKYTGDRNILLKDVGAGRASMEDFVAQMTTEDLSILIRGEGMCSAKVTPGTAAAFGGITDRLFKFGIPVAAATDGPSGIRMDSGHKATQVPIGTLLACTWNLALNEELFSLVGQELRLYNIDTLLGPGINIHRHPLNGRNFEYFSEDSLLTGCMAAAQTRGLAQAGVSGTIKHFVANDQETNRSHVDSVASERVLREIHLRGFEMAVKEGSATSIMTGYNPVNGNWTASNYDLVTTILRGEWGYTGIVMTDWWAKMNDPAKGGKEDSSFTGYMIRAQNDLYMVVANDKAALNPRNDNTLEALDKGVFTLGELQRSAMNICRFILAAPVMSRPLVAYEPVKKFVAKVDSLKGVVPIEEGLPLATKTNIDAAFEVTVPGVYLVRAHAQHNKDNLAQSVCSLYLNDHFAMSIPLNGNDGVWVDVDGIAVRLEKGFYKLSVDFVKPGLEIAHLNFIRKE